MKAFILAMIWITQISLTQRVQDTTWVLVDGGFDANSTKAVFERFDSNKHNQFVYEAFQFNKDQSMTFSRINPKKMGFCGTGLFQMKKGNWSQVKKGWKVEMEAGRLGMSDFKFSRQYDITLAGDTLTLSLKKEELFEEENPYMKF